MESRASNTFLRSTLGILPVLLGLLGRSLTIIGPAILMMVCALSGYAVRPIIDELVKRPENLIELAHGLRRAALDQFYGVPVIFPNPTPVKLIPDTTPTKIDETAALLPSTEIAATKSIPKIAPLIPGMGIPKPVKTYRVNPSGSIIGENTN